MPWRIFFAIILGTALVVAIVLIGSRVVNGLVDDRVEEENQKEQVYDYLDGERIDPSKVGDN